MDGVTVVDGEGFTSWPHLLIGCEHIEALLVILICLESVVIVVACYQH